MSIASEVDDASEQYNLYRLLNNDEYISVGVTDVYGTEKSYYVEVTTTDHDTISVFIRLPRLLNNNGENTVSDSPLRLLAGVFAETDGELRVTECELHINPEFDTEANRSGDVMVKTPNTEFELEMLTSLPASATELSRGEKQALQWKANIVAWYQDTETNGRVETRIQYRVDGDERRSLSKAEVDDRFLTVSDEVIRADGQTTATFQLMLGEEKTTMSFCIPPDGRRPDIVSTFIEASGGTLENVENENVVLFPYGSVPEYVYEHIAGEEELLTTDDGLFIVVMEDEINKARKVDYKQNRTESIIQAVFSIVTIAVLGIIGYSVYVGAGAVNAFLLTNVGSLGRNITFAVFGFMLLDALFGVFRDW